MKAKTSENTASLNRSDAVGWPRFIKAYHPQLDRYVAIKVLRSDLVEEVEFLARFRREARAVAALRHPHIVQIYDFDVQEDLYYMVMELLEGDTLKAHLNSLRVHGEHLPLGEMVRIFSDVLDGLAYAHGEGIIHRDLKPANIMLTRRGQAVLTDFGIAQIVGGTQYTVCRRLDGNPELHGTRTGTWKGVVISAVTFIRWGSPITKPSPVLSHSMRIHRWRS